MATYGKQEMDVNEGILKTVMIHARDLDDAWHQALFALINGNGYVCRIDKGSYENTEYRLEFDHIVINVEKPGQRPIVPITAEFVPPPTDVSWVKNIYLNKLVTDERGSGEDYTYGERNVAPAKFLEEIIKSPFELKNEFKNLNQMIKVIENFTTKGYNSNQEVIQIASPLDLWKKDPPCLRKIFCRIRYGKLHFITDWRSWDLWAGFPSNLAGLQLVKEFMAEEIGVEDGGMLADSQGLHLYSQYWSMAEQELKLPIEKWKARNCENLKAVHDDYMRVQEKKIQD